MITREQLDKAINEKKAKACELNIFGKLLGIFNQLHPKLVDSVTIHLGSNTSGIYKAKCSRLEANLFEIDVIKHTPWAGPQLVFNATGHKYATNVVFAILFEDYIDLIDKLYNGICVTAEQKKIREGAARWMIDLT